MDEKEVEELTMSTEEEFEIEHKKYRKAFKSSEELDLPLVHGDEDGPPTIRNPIATLK